ncbi:hypothetical protein MKW98_025155 [Papaver atlanticum]|uniref:Fanconi-associated nuclease n=1 Tax=Papaver atlanticum TaxID=357466 RepID=A0AAD4S350_9MAGN|nr:hypothetical protein MKW98_025155 [Papaver atlanticum]
MLPKHEVDGSTDRTLVAIFQIFISGRFGEEVDLRIGNAVSFVRDQYNVKDPSAIKVLCRDNGFEEVVGHIPWELARYLSPVIEKDCLIFEVVCQRMTRIDVIESNNHGGSDSGREDVLHVVDHDIFVRLFTRKGPLFRVTNISYQEVTDPQQAIEGLCARCYGCSFESLKESDGYI